ncbi:MAG: hypothetical protein RLZZ505_2341 [Verrucomicrobiota bacterium]
MSILLQNPAFLPLLALAGVPILVHLISKAKPPEYRFSDIAFLRKIITVTARFKKPKDYLILALRTLALLALAAAFLLPLLLSENSPLPGEKRTVILVIDRSASMAANEGAASRFDAATALASETLSSSRPDLANIVWIDSAPTAVFPEPAPNIDFLADETAKAAPLPQAGAIAPAIELALRQLSDAPGRRELHIISDFQESAWKTFAPAIPKDVIVTMSKVAETDPANLAVTSLVPVPSSPVAGQQVVVQTRVANFSAEPRRISLTLDAGGSRQSQTLELPANGEAEAAFSVRVANPGLLPLTAEIDADAFPGDDRRHSVIRVRESLRLAIAAPETDPAAATLAKVADAIPWLELIPSADPARLPPCEILCLPYWKGTDPETLAELSKTLSLLVIPAPDCPAAALAALLGEQPDPASTLFPLQTDPKGWEAVPAAAHPAFALFSGGQFGNPMAGKFRQRLKLPAYPSVETLASFSDSAPALILAKGRPILIAAFPLDPAHTTWPTESPFLPAIAEILLHLEPGTASETFAALPGDTLAWTNPAMENSITPVLEAPDGTTTPLTASGATWSSTAPAIPGIHRWLVSDQPVHLTAVNFPESESDLTPLMETPALGASTATSGTARHASNAAGLPLWPLLIAAALLFLLAEALLAAHGTPKLAKSY